jgi:hypothetical protein
MRTDGWTNNTYIIFAFAIFRTRLKIRQCVEKSLRLQSHSMIPFSYLATGQDLKVGKRWLCKGTYEDNICDLSFQSHRHILTLFCHCFMFQRMSILLYVAKNRRAV